MKTEKSTSSFFLSFSPFRLSLYSPSPSSSSRVLPAPRRMPGVCNMCCCVCGCIYAADASLSVCSFGSLFVRILLCFRRAAKCFSWMWTVLCEGFTSETRWSTARQGDTGTSSTAGLSATSSGRETLHSSTTTSCLLVRCSSFSLAATHLLSSGREKTAVQREREKICTGETDTERERDRHSKSLLLATRKHLRGFSLHCPLPHVERDKEERQMKRKTHTRLFLSLSVSFSLRI